MRPDGQKAQYQMKLKLDDKNQVVVQDGKPVYVAEDGKEVVFDYPATLATISRLNGEARGHRERAESAEAKVKTFEGIEDPEEARKALGIVKNLDTKKLIDAGKIDEVKAEAQKAFDEKLKGVEESYKPIVTERDALKNQLFAEKVGGAFSRSKFIGEKLAIPSDMAQARFGENFTIEEGKVVAKDAAGNRIFSRARPGEIADFDEALEMLVDAYPYKDNILKGTGASGGGAGGTGGAGGKKTMTRAQFDGLDAAARVAAVKDTQIID
jgi:hypothetical protein